MTPSRKGLYDFCKNCKHKLDIDTKYPCKFSHKQVRGIVKYERDFNKCLLLEEKEINLGEFKMEWYNDENNIGKLIKDDKGYVTIITKGIFHRGYAEHENGCTSPLQYWKPALKEDIDNLLIKCTKSKQIKLSEFLKENDAYDKFIKNFDDDYFEYLSTPVHQLMISNAFNWKLSPEGHKYWYQLNYKFEEKMIIIKYDMDWLLDKF